MPAPVFEVFIASVELNCRTRSLEIRWATFHLDRYELASWLSLVTDYLNVSVDPEVGNVLFTPYPTQFSEDYLLNRIYT